MVTQIVKNEDIHPGFMSINRWIKYGITDYAVEVCICLMNETHEIYNDVDEVRNKFHLNYISSDEVHSIKNQKIYNNPINPLNKW